MKKVILMLTALSMMAMLGACKSSDDDDDEGDSKEAKARKFAREMCECKGDYECIENVREKMAKFAQDLDTAELFKLNDIFMKEYDKCSNDDDDDDKGYDDRSNDQVYDANNPYTDGASLGEQVCNCYQMSGYEQDECMKRAEEEYYRLRGKYSGSQLDDFESALGLAVQNCSMNSVENAVQEAIEGYDYSY